MLVLYSRTDKSDIEIILYLHFQHCCAIPEINCKYDKTFKNHTEDHRHTLRVTFRSEGNVCKIGNDDGVFIMTPGNFRSFFEKYA